MNQSTENSLKKQVKLLRITLAFVLFAFFSFNFGFPLQNGETPREAINCPPPTIPTTKMDMTTAQKVTNNFQTANPNAACAFQLSNSMIYHAFNEIIADTNNEIEGFRCYYGTSDDGNLEHVIFRSLTADGSEINRGSEYEFKAVTAQASNLSPYWNPCPNRCDQTESQGNGGAFD